jgi:type II secretory pathway pseudopilin PulG
MKDKSKQAGFSLLEISMVAGIIVVLSVLAIIGFQAAKQSADLARAVTNLNALTASVRNTFASQGDYTSLSNTSVLTSNTLPENMRVPASTTLIKSPYANDGFTVSAANVGGTANDGFQMDMKLVPARACQDFVSQVYRNYDTVSVGGSAVTSVATAATACSGTGAKTLTFTAR